MRLNDLPLLTATALLLVTTAGSAAGEPKPAATGTVLIDKCQIKVVDRALLAAERNGVIGEISATDGMTVEAGRELIRLKDDALRSQLEVAAARAENDISVRYSRVVADTAKASYDAGLELERQKALSAFQLRQRKLEYDRGILGIEQAAHEFRLAALDARLAEAQLAECKIVAPFAGTVTRVFKRRGESVVNGEPVVELVNSDRVHVEGYGDLSDAWAIQAGAPVKVRLNSPELEQFDVVNREFDGKLILVDVVVQPVTQKVRIVAELPNPEHLLREGLMARMQIFPEEPAPDAPAEEKAAAVR